MTTSATDNAESLAVGALDWLLKAARDVDGGLAWPDTLTAEQTTPILYNGTSGVLTALLDAWSHFADDRYADAAVRGARSVADAVDGWGHSGLHTGVAGMAVALRGVHRVLGDTEAGAAADRALDLLRSRYDGAGWNDCFELIAGNAGIALAALECGDLDLAGLAVDRYPSTAETTAGGVQWEIRTGVAPRMHHMSHGTLGIVYALAAVGRAADRPDLVELASAGAADVISRNEAGPDGFLVAHSDPQQQHEKIERHSYGWCHGTAGDAQAFRLLSRILPDDPTWPALVDRCWHTLVNSGIPQRIRPGFWDNNGRCCGTAGVLALACDRQAECGDGHAFARVLVADLAARARTDADGTCWSNAEHRETPSDLDPATGWAMGNAGIIRELLRYARTTSGRDPRYAVPFPDQPPTA
ncbi:lanthionine synthetase LanC family protein [Streptomyces sp. NBC_00338]|uniref:lanthionine synthetase LanC family protein n=1 Tax=Streptomyces sp. NBC_00338 TaxID=2975715 RepID=UPI002257227E|nr:lanthionine synthetase LanC family protein [Streptomyces sp. NBC_00338]MCX5144991.1 lanthionine synthetase C family protein [Streptomyces sp. NBC_00338]